MRSRLQDICEDLCQSLYGQMEHFIDGVAANDVNCCEANLRKMQDALRSALRSLEDMNMPRMELYTGKIRSADSVRWMTVPAQSLAAAYVQIRQGLLADESLDSVRSASQGVN
jgi:hypothetical protein